MTTENKSRTFGDDAEELLARFPGVNREKLLVSIIAVYGFMNMRYGNKAEEKEACDFLNFVQEQAALQLKRTAEPSNDQAQRPGLAATNQKQNE